MANTTEEVPGGEPQLQPNFKAIQALIAPNGELENAEKKQAEAMSGIGHIFKRVEKDMHGNRAAVSLMRKPQKMSADKRNDFIRTLEPLLVEAGYTLEAIDPEDLVGTPAPSPAPTPPSGSSDGDEDGDDTTEDDQRGSNLSGHDALAAARAKLSSGGAGQIGSKQLRTFLGAIEAGQGVTESALHAGLSPAEAEATMKARDAGELEDVEPIAFVEPTKGGRPKLGMVAGGRP